LQMNNLANAQTEENNVENFQGHFLSLIQKKHYYLWTNIVLD